MPRIVHFDDPFGATMERRTARTNVFARELDTFLRLAREYEHVRAVVTTRLNIFREEVRGTHGGARLAELEKNIRVHTSYRRETLLDILHRYMTFYKPRWASDERIVAALDARLPGLLPAPHNIEFFVRTSESLTTLEEVLRHVEESKEMVKALADWMGYLPAPEQIFLLLVEITASAAVLFPGTPASAVDLEGSYMEMLAYLFKRRHLPGIPSASFENARGKFDMILVERRDEETGLMRFDFVHPSYHEAFWHAVRRRSPLSHWWEIMQKEVADIFKDFDNKPDLVQLRMIERYGSIDRDLDRLLLLSADIDDVQEQIIAFEHMLAHPEKFAHLPQFARSLSSITATDNEQVKLKFLSLVDERFNQLPLAVIDAVPALLFDGHQSVRAAAEKVASKYLRGEDSPVKDNERLRAWELLRKLFEPYSGYLHGHKDLVYLMQFASDIPYQQGFVFSWSELPLNDFKFLIPLDYHSSVVMELESLVGRLPYHKLPEDKLEFLLSCRDSIRYRALSEMLVTYKSLSGKTKEIADSLASNPQEPWVGGSIGRATTTYIMTKETAALLSPIVTRTAKQSPKEVAGALLAEMAQLDRRSVLQGRYKTTLSSTPSA